MRKHTRIILVALILGMVLMAQQPVSQGPQAANVQPWQVIPTTPGTGSSTAVTPFHVVGSTSTFNTVKGSAGNLYGISVFNPNSTACYLVFYNNAAPSIGTTTIVYAFGIQAGVSKDIPVGQFALGNFSTAITIAGTTTDGGSGVCATGMSTNVYYQ